MSIEQGSTQYLIQKSKALIDKPDSSTNIYRSYSAFAKNYLGDANIQLLKMLMILKYYLKNT